MNNGIFTCDPILSVPGYKQLITTFTLSRGKGLENYLKKCAEDEELDHLNNTYLVRDMSSNELVAYFSLKAGTISLESGLFFRNNRQAIPGIELSNFAANENYKINHNNGIQVGKVIFYDFILPIVKDVSKMVAVNAIYIFALPEDRLIAHYQGMGFNRLTKKAEKSLHRRTKPTYDNGCIFMYQLLY